MIITGSRASLSYDIISRIKRLFQDANLEDSAMSYVYLNNVKVEGYPSDSVSGRGKPNVSAIFVDESSFWEPSQTQNVMDMVQGYFVKSNPYTLIASSPSQPADLMDLIFKENENETVWRRLKMDWKYAENLLYTPAKSKLHKIDQVCVQVRPGRPGYTLLLQINNTTYDSSSEGYRVSQSLDSLDSLDGWTSSSLGSQQRQSRLLSETEITFRIKSLTSSTLTSFNPLQGKAFTSRGLSTTILYWIVGQFANPIGD